MFVVAGVSGNTGKVVANGLLDAGKKVRVIVRDAAKGAAFKARGAEVAVAEISNVEAFTKALEGCEAGYFLCPAPQVVDGFKAGQRKIADALLKSITDSKLPRVVLLSSVGADQENGTGPIDVLCYVERKLSAMPINATFLRAAYFQENWGMILGAANAQSIVPTFLKPDFSFSQISTLDIGRIAIEALLHPPAKTTAWNLAGPKEYSANDVTAALSKALGKPLTAVYIPAAGAAGALQQTGMPADIAGVFGEMYQSIDSGKIAPVQSLPLKRGSVTLDETFSAMVKGGQTAH